MLGSIPLEISPSHLHFPAPGRNRSHHAHDHGSRRFAGSSYAFGTLRARWPRKWRRWSESSRTSSAIPIHSSMSSSATAACSAANGCGRLCCCLRPRRSAAVCSRTHQTLAAVVEMIHTATLVHDDVLDEADMRTAPGHRQRPLGQRSQRPPRRLSSSPTPSTWPARSTPSSAAG